MASRRFLRATSIQAVDALVDAVTATGQDAGRGTRDDDSPANGRGADADQDRARSAAARTGRRTATRRTPGASVRRCERAPVPRRVARARCCPWRRASVHHGTGARRSRSPPSVPRAARGSTSRTCDRRPTACPSPGRTRVAGRPGTSPRPRSSRGRCCSRDRWNTTEVRGRRSDGGRQDSVLRKVCSARFSDHPDCYDLTSRAGRTLVAGDDQSPRRLVGGEGLAVHAVSQQDAPAT